MANYTIGVDLGGTNLRIAAVGETGRLIEKLTLGAQVALGRDHVVTEMCGAIRQVAARHRDAGQLLGIGIGVPGIIDMHTGMVRQSPNLADWIDYPAQSVIEKQLGTRVFLENDANSAALGEKWLGAARDFDDMVMLTMGTGVGGGIVLGGRVWRGMTGMAGELGHMTVEPDGHPCGCGNKGCLEQYASATAVVRMAKEAIAKGAKGLARAASNDPDFSAKAVYNLAIQGDEDARKVFRRVGRALGIALSGWVNGLNLPIYVVGGGVSSAWDMFAPAIFEELRWRSMVYKATAPQSAGAGDKTLITRAQLGSDAGLYGAARLPMVQ